MPEINLNAPRIAVRVEAHADNFRPYDHQTASWNAMTRCFVEDGKKSGIVVLPTGGGKTIVAARWLLQHHIRGGGRVLWLAHRKTLLEQARRAFIGHAHLSAPNPDFRAVIVSSDHDTWSGVADGDNVVFSTFQSAVLPDNAGFVERIAGSSDKPIFVVVDECHHSAAKTYFRLLNKLKDDWKVSLLGLTATPVRTDEDDSRRLWEVFGGNIVYEVNIRTLIEKGILSIPNFETVETKINQDREFSPEDFEHLKRFGELGPHILERLAKNTARNRFIVKHYSDHALRYNKTILFAIDTMHAQMLAQDFKEAGIPADYVDFKRTDTDTVLEAFRDRPEPVLITNVEILTEGFDAPQTRTVFVCRPTRSESLLAQMVGRALRGPAAGGTDEAYLVTFVDTWETYNPLDAHYAVLTGIVDPEPVGLTRTPPQLVTVSAELIREAYRLVQSTITGTIEGYHACLAHSWFTWEQVTEDNIVRRAVLVFENQVEGYQRLKAEIIDAGKIPANLTDDFSSGLRNRYFSDIPDPRPSVADIWALLDAYQQEIVVNHYTFKEKSRFAPRILGPELKESSPGQRRERLQEIWESDPVCQLVYQDDFDAFDRDVRDEIERIVGSVRPPAPTIIIDLVPQEPPRPWPDGEPGYNLVEVWNDVTVPRIHFPRGVPRVSDIRFSNDPLRWGGWAFYRADDRTVMITSALNSPDIPLFVVEFLVYHELLHAYMPHAGHNAEFREHERKRFTPSQKALDDAQTRRIKPGKGVGAWRILADQYLDTLHTRFAIEGVNRPPTY